ncbi:CubicO group peptidase (beta-lactamase class C family) [Aquimarina sp. MAR_2010_214]|uniref:serine hydrolase domain-containing protein n=1 Tax=Aquimarina sp. MAR_2010_214 TaxID=1250026 RepID=UPI000C713C3C|nr:serine hydrolase [Aquimarina sp. MAR_2010_214]PKV48687.1 CubicO group peptidase (beta-lactamase class C family) [Aquimarina sp. MAR_2010_214]
MKRLKKIIGITFLILFAGICIAFALNYPKLTILSGYSAKYMNSSVFIANRSVEFTDINDTNFSPVHLADDEVDMKKRASVASVFGLKERKAIYREGLGSVLIDDDFDENTPVLIPRRIKTETRLSYPYGELEQKDTVFTTVDYDKVNKTVTSIFDTNGEYIKKTRAVLVLYKDQIIAEKYIDELDKDSKLLGWSMTKSILSTVYGVLQKQGAINIHDKAPVSAWQNDERKEITINNLLQMNCGLEWDEDYGSISDVTKMLYVDKDMTTPQIHKKAIHKPNEHWYYSSGVSNLLSGVLRKQFKSYQEYLDYPYREFIDKIGMNSMLIETDMTGNYVGSSYAWATVRDWGKFGLLYLHKGNWNGEQIFEPSWADYVTTPSPTSEGDYGGHFWLNAGGFYPDAPRDMFSANGFQGQRVFIIPSKDLVIVRFGLIGDAGVDFNTFLKELVSAIK